MKASCDPEGGVQIPLAIDSCHDTNTMKLKDFITENVPQVADGYKYWLKPTLFNGTLQSLYTFKGDFHNKFKVYYAREIISVSQSEVDLTKHEYHHLAPGEFTIDYVVDPKSGEENSETFKARCKETLPEGYPRLHPRCRYYTDDELNEIYDDWSSDDKPITIIIPGLAGGIQEAPIRGTCDELHKRGHHVLVYNTRGCSRSKITTPYLFHGLMTDDLKYIIHHLRSRYGSFEKRQIHLVGFSFGGLIMANYLAFEGKDSQVTSGCSISSPWDLVASGRHIVSSWSGVYLFQPAVVHFLLNFTKNNMPVLDGQTEHFSWEKYNAVKGSIKTSEDFDDNFTCKVAGFPSGRAYYYAASPSIRVLKIKTPMLVLNTADDPMIDTDYPIKEIKKNPYLYMATTDLGGHYSSITTNGDFWFSNVVGKWADSWNKSDTSKPIKDNDYNLAQTRYKTEINLYG